MTLGVSSNLNQFLERLSLNSAEALVLHMTNQRLYTVAKPFLLVRFPKLSSSFTLHRLNLDFVRNLFKMRHQQQTKRALLNKNLQYTKESVSKCQFSIKIHTHTY